MISIAINKEYYKFMDEYSSKLDLGGFSNLSKSDLNKSTRKQYQITGIVGEMAFYLWRYNSIDKLKSNMDKKIAYYEISGLGDGGHDDAITYKDKTRFVDIKTSHVTTKDKIQYLNLVIPKREMHHNMIYVAAFSVGPDRSDVSDVILSGWVFNEEIHKKWKYDESKFCVPVSDLKPMEDLKLYL